MSQDMEKALNEEVEISLNSNEIPEQDTAPEMQNTTDDEMQNVIDDEAQNVPEDSFFPEEPASETIVVKKDVTVEPWDAEKEAEQTKKKVEEEKSLYALFADMMNKPKIKRVKPWLAWTLIGATLAVAILVGALVIVSALKEVGI